MGHETGNIYSLVYLSPVLQKTPTTISLFDKVVPVLINLYFPFRHKHKHFFPDLDLDNSLNCPTVVILVVVIWLILKNS